jgi:hypothetical protein
MTKVFLSFLGGGVLDIYKIPKINSIFWLLNTMLQNATQQNVTQQNVT